MDLVVFLFELSLALLSSGSLLTIEDTSYLIHQQISSGSTSVVYLATTCDESDYFAIKEISLTSASNVDTFYTSSSNVEKEIEMMKLAKGHPNIVTFYAAEIRFSTAYIVMEYCSGGTAVQMAKESGYGVGEDVVRDISRQLSSAVKFLYQKRIIHRDIKLDNLLVCSQDIGSPLVVKLADFGFATLLDHDKELTYIVGSVPYMVSLTPNCFEEV